MEEADRAEAHFAPRARGPGITDASAAVVPSTALPLRHQPHYIPHFYGPVLDPVDDERGLTSEAARVPAEHLGDGSVPQRRMALVHLSQDLELLLDGHAGRMLEREHGQLGRHVVALEPGELGERRVDHVLELAQHHSRVAGLLLPGWMFLHPLALVRARGAYGGGRVGILVLVHLVDLHLVPRGAGLAGLLRRGRDAEVVREAGLAVELVNDVPELLCSLYVTHTYRYRKMQRLQRDMYLRDRD